MQKKLCKVVYDTDNATIVKKCTYGNFGDSNGYEETLYQTPNGLYFVYVNGGVDSPYTKEDIMRLSKEKAEAWLNERS